MVHDLKEYCKEKGDHSAYVMDLLKEFEQFLEPWRSKVAAQNQQMYVSIFYLKLILLLHLILHLILFLYLFLFFHLFLHLFLLRRTNYGIVKSLKQERRSNLVETALELPVIMTLHYWLHKSHSWHLNWEFLLVH